MMIAAVRKLRGRLDAIENVRHLRKGFERQ